jgi:Tfp pilus assembly protein PilN
MLRINLQLPIEASTRPSARGRKRMAIRDVFYDPGVLATGLLGLIVLAGCLYTDFTQKAQLREISGRVQSAVADSALLEGDLQQAKRLREQRAVIIERLNKIKGIDQNRFAFVHIMDDASTKLVSEMYLDSMEVTAQDSSGVHVRISGVAPTPAIVGSFMRGLELSPFIKGVVSAGTVKQQIHNQDVTKFAVTAMSEIADSSLITTETINQDGSHTTGTGAAPTSGYPTSPPVGPPGVSGVPALPQATPASGVPNGGGLPGTLGSPFPSPGAPGRGGRSSYSPPLSRAYPEPGRPTVAPSPTGDQRVIDAQVTAPSRADLLRRARKAP